MAGVAPAVFVATIDPHFIFQVAVLPPRDALGSRITSPGTPSGPPPLALHYTLALIIGKLGKPSRTLLESALLVKVKAN